MDIACHWDLHVCVLLPFLTQIIDKKIVAESRPNPNASRIQFLRATFSSGVAKLSSLREEKLTENHSTI